jgi:hypothetical protein
MDGVEEILNLQPKDGKGKPYQVKQVRNVILKYRLRGACVIKSLENDDGKEIRNHHFLEL